MIILEHIGKNHQQRPLHAVLQEKIQAQGLPAPKYQVAEEDGPDHNKIFTIEVIIDGKEKTKGIGKSKSEAEQDAAMNALRNMVK